MHTDAELIQEAHELLQRGYAADAKRLIEGRVRLRESAAVAEPLAERAMDKSVGGGVDRDKLPDADFAGKNRSFPIVTPGDVSDAAKSIGRAGADNYSSDELKARIIAIAKRKGAAFEAELPDAWKAKSKEAAVLTHAAALEALFPHLGGNAAEIYGRLTEAGRTFSKATKDAISGHCSTLMQVHDGLKGMIAEKPDADEAGGMTGMEAERTSIEVEDGAERLTEAASSGGGKVLLKLISPGWGTWGYYGEKMLKRDGPAAFPAGTFNMWNHQTESERSERPEGDLNNAASVLTENARWLDDGPKGKGLYAWAKVFSDHAQKVQEKGPHIGVSINASGKRVPGEADGKRGMIIEALAPASGATDWNTADYVTRPGRGGAVIVQESATPPATAAGASVPAPEPLKETNGMAIDAREFEALQESVGNLKAKLDEQGIKLGQLSDEKNQLQEALNLQKAREFARRKLSKIEGLPVPTRERVAEAVAKDPPLKDGKLNETAFEPIVEAAARREVAYLAEVGALDGRVTGMGAGMGQEDEDPAKIEGRLQESFKAFGLSEQGAKVAAAGRAS